MSRPSFSSELADVITTITTMGVRWGWQPHRRQRSIVLFACTLGVAVGWAFDWSPLWFWSIAVAAGYLIGRPVIGRQLWFHHKRQQYANAHRAAPPIKELRRQRKIERGRVKYLQQQWPPAMRAYKVLDEAKAHPPLRHLRSNVDGDLQAHVSTGSMVVAGGGAKLIANRGGIAEIVGCRTVTVRSSTPGEYGLSFLWTDEFERDLPIQRLPEAKGDRIAYGIHRDASVASLDPNKSVLVAGVQGSGKSSMVWTILAHYLRRGEWVDLYVIDPKGGQEWGWLQRMATIDTCRVKVVEFVTDDAAALPMLKRVEARVKDRQERLGLIDLDDWSADPMRQHKPTRDEPRIVVLMDELLHLRNSIHDTATKPSPVGKIISIGRSACATVIAVSQDATKATVGMVRDLFGQRIALRTASASMTDMVLAEGAEAAGATCSMIPESTPGIGFAYDSDHHGFVEVRIAHVSDDDIRNDIQWGRPPSGMIGNEIVTVEPYVVYRFYTADDQPLRVGITNDFDRRRGEYEASYRRELAAVQSGHLDPRKALHLWWADVDHTRTRLRDFDSKPDAKAAESQYIATGAWRGNHQENMNASLRNVPTVPEPLKPPRLRLPALPSRAKTVAEPDHPFPLYDQRYDEGWQSDLEEVS